MKVFYPYVNKGIVLAIFLFALNINGFSQERTLTPFPGVIFSNAQIVQRYGHASLANGYYESLPASYNNTTGKYPVLVVFHGYGEVGYGNSNDLPKVLDAGIMRYLKARTFPETFSVNNNTFSFIVIAPQFNRSIETNPNNGSATFNSVIDYVIAHYPRADLTRIYATGLSAGGGITWYGVGKFVEDARRLAGIVTMAGAGGYEGWPEHIGQANLPMWSLVNADDEFFARDTPGWVDGANSVNPGIAIKTIYPNGGHDVWSKISNPNFREQSNNNLSVYEWLLTKQRTDIVLPVVLGSYNVTAVNPGNEASRKVTVAWTTTYEQNNAFFTVARSADGTNFSQITKIAALTQGQGNNYSFTDATPLSGSSYYRLSQTDLDGTVKNFDIKTINFENGPGAELVRIYPNPVSDQLYLEINNKVTGKLNATVIGTDGKTVLQLQFTKPDRFLRQTISIGSLTNGQYVLKITGNEYLSTLKFIKN